MDEKKIRLVNFIINKFIILNFLSGAYREGQEDPNFVSLIVLLLLIFVHVNLSLDFNQMNSLIKKFGCLFDI